MREAFITKKFGAASLILLGKILEVLESYEDQGYDLSLRQLYYQLVSANVIPNSERSYKNLGNLVSDARLAGIIDWNAIRDRGRNANGNSHWTSPASIIDTCIHSFQIDKWLNQPNYVELMVEKQALEGVLGPVCSDLDITYTSNKGYSSSSTMYAASKRFLDRAEQGKRLHVIYLGDHDPSGIDMTRDVIDRLELFIDTSLGERSEITVHRIALNMDQIKKLKPPENPAKLTDSRAKGYIRKFGRSSWELDAIEPKALSALVTNAVVELRDEDLWDDAMETETAMVDELKAFAKTSKFK